MIKGSDGTNWNPKVLDDNIANGFSEFTSAKIPDHSELLKSARYWSTDHFLNSVLRVRWSEDYRYLAFNYILRAELFVRAYEGARVATELYLDRDQTPFPNPSRFFTTLNEWEQVLRHFQILTEVSNRLPKNPSAFLPGDGSPSQRMWEMNNDIKHRLSKGQRTPIWLSEYHIHSVGCHGVSFEEISALLGVAADGVDFLKDPISAVERRKRQRG